MNQSVKTFLVAVALLAVTAIVITFVSRTEAPTDPNADIPNIEQPENTNDENENTASPISSYKDLIRVELAANQVVDGSFTLKGQARGPWFFEASFPIRIEDEQGLLGTVIAQADGDWMTSEYVPFTANMVFDKPRSATGVIIFEKENPSGLPEHADEFRIPVTFR